MQHFKKFKELRKTQFNRRIKAATVVQQLWKTQCYRRLRAVATIKLAYYTYTEKRRRMKAATLVKCAYHKALLFMLRQNAARVIQRKVRIYLVWLHWDRGERCKRATCIQKLWRKYSSNQVSALVKLLSLDQNATKICTFARTINAKRNLKSIRRKAINEERHRSNAENVFILEAIVFAIQQATYFLLTLKESLVSHFFYTK